ncbi:pyridoxal-phosphate dependent enzyme [Actinomadura namibiensis]|uniref:Diaminopropionate ammonia-lyase n=1 Tax=Actinomadura namibiensis TaxID=182080 RepID=A0A7W3QKJ3_ACTNM|nr:pyridoxal-phosphate dependent enzyme [Actinomadura namibiensis]MBA8950594.1 diaminopropionate ammonia-lyase [Actinomadura namibiensis]
MAAPAAPAPSADSSAGPSSPLSRFTDSWFAHSWFTRPPARLWRCDPAPADVAGFHAMLPGYAPTPLVEVPALAAELGADRVFVKDESRRMGLPAFKILGAAWGVRRAIRAHGRPERLVAATDGNHGRAVARIARLLGLPARVLVPEHVPAAARAAIAAEDAEVVVVRGSYDAAVRRAAAEPGLLVQDTAWPGYEEIPGWIVEGYSTLFREVDAQLAAAGAAPAGLVAVPMGVGSLAQAAVVHYRSGGSAPTLLGVEPDTAASVLTSLIADRLTTVPDGDTVMAGLNCPTPSTLAWPVLRAGLDAAVAVPDAAALRAARDLAGHGVPAGPCGAAALAGVRAALTPTRRPSLSPAHTGTVVLLSTEGVTGPPARAERGPRPSSAG